MAMSQSPNQFYELLIQQLESLLENQDNWITNLSQFTALINMSLDKVNWVGFYLAQPGGALKLGPFQGNVACFDIPMGQGVCGSAAESKETLIVADVDQFPGHIACDAASRSELVCPIIINDKLIGVLDIDSPILDRFTQEDKVGIEALVNVLIQSTRWPL